MNIEWFGPTSEEFIKLLSYVKLFDEYPVIAAASVLALIRAIKTAQSLDPTAVREAFNKLHIITIYGLFKIDPTTGEQIAAQTVLGQWQNAKLVVV